MSGPQMGTTLCLSKSTLSVAWQAFDESDTTEQPVVFEEVRAEILGATESLPSHDTEAPVTLQDSAWLVVYGAVTVSTDSDEITDEQRHVALNELQDSFPPTLSTLASHVELTTEESGLFD
jgi:hypothetical protein